MRINNMQAATLASAALGAASMFHTVNAQSNLVWMEEFNYENGAPNPDLWSYDVGGGGWGNNELQVYTSSTDNSVVEDNILRIRARKNEVDNTFTSARLKTEGKFSFTYGTLEARIKVPTMDAGLWPAFWTLGTDFYAVGWPKAGEIDIMEMGQGLAINEGKVHNRVVSAAHWDIFGQYATYARSYDSPEDLTQDFHVYKMEWTPTKISTYVDDDWIWEIDISDGECPSCSELHQPHHIMLNMAVGGGFTSGGESSSAASSSCAGSSSSAGASSSGGCPSRGPDDITAPLPGEMQVDWIRLYDNGSTIITTPPTMPPTLVPIPVTNAPVQPTPAPTPSNRQPLVTPEPTKAPTPRPTVAVFTQPTDPPVPVSTREPVILPSEGGGKAGKAGKGSSSGSRSRANRQPAGGKGKGKGKGGSSFNRQGTSSGKGGKGKGYSAYSSGRTEDGGLMVDGTYATDTTTLPAARDPTGTVFLPVTGEEDADGPIFRTGPSSLVVELEQQEVSAIQSSSSQTGFFLSMMLSGFVTLGVLAGVTSL